VWYFQQKTWQRMSDAFIDEVNEKLFNQPYQDALAAALSQRPTTGDPFPTQVSATHYWQRGRKHMQTIYTLYLKEMYQASSDNGTTRKIRGWYDDDCNRPFSWEHAHEQFLAQLDTMIQHRHMGVDANDEGDGPEPNTTPLTPLHKKSLAAAIRDVPLPTIDEGDGSQPSGEVVTSDQTSYDDNRCAGASVFEKPSRPPPRPPPGTFQPKAKPRVHWAMGSPGEHDVETGTGSVSLAVPSWHPQDPHVKRWTCPAGFVVGSKVASAPTDDGSDLAESVASYSPSDDSWNSMQRWQFSNEEMKAYHLKEIHRLDAMDMPAASSTSEMTGGESDNAEGHWKVI
jgi:hypothetical protein